MNKVLESAGIFYLAIGVWTAIAVLNVESGRFTEALAAGVFWPVYLWRFL